MEAPPFAAVVPVDPVWRKKRSFWIWNIVASGVLMILAPLGAMLISLGGMKGTFGRMETSGADVEMLAVHIDQMLVTSAIGFGISMLMLIWLIVAVVRLCLMPASPFPHSRMPQ